MRCLTLFEAIAALAVATSTGLSASWVESFETGVGRFDQTIGNPAAYSWDANGQMLSCDFTNRGVSDVRYGLLDQVYDAQSNRLEFNAIITPVEAVILDPSGSAAGGRFGLFSLGDDDRFTQAVDVTFSHLPSKPRRFSVSVGYADGTAYGGTSAYGQYLNFDFGVTYFVSTVIDGINGTIITSLHEGSDASGTLVGSLSWDIIPEKELQFSAFGFWNPSYSNDHVLRANFHEVAFVPEPSTALLLGIGGMVMMSRRRRGMS